MVIIHTAEKHHSKSGTKPAPRKRRRAAEFERGCNGQSLSESPPPTSPTLALESARAAAKLQVELRQIVLQVKNRQMISPNFTLN